MFTKQLPPKTMYYRQVGGLYVLHDAQGVELSVCAEVALLFDARENILLQHGLPAIVDYQYRRMHIDYVAAGLHDLAEDLVVLRGQFDVAELNKVLSQDRYIGEFHAQLQRHAARQAQEVLQRLSVG